MNEDRIVNYMLMFASGSLTISGIRSLFEIQLYNGPGVIAGVFIGPILAAMAIYSEVEAK